METIAAVPKPGISSYQREIQWKQLYSLCALYASISIGWIAYQNYQPRLLVQFAFTDLTFLLMVAQGVIVVITPMIAGRLGDYYRLEKGHRLPIISSAISVAAMVFMAVAFTLLGNPGEVFRWILPILIVFWLISMSIFTSPALSTIELFTPLDKLPRAMALLTITGNLVYALEPVVVDIIDFAGAPITFMLGGFIVFLSGYALRKHSLDLFRMSGDKEAESVSRVAGISSKGFIFFLGFSLGITTTLLFYWFPSAVHEKLSTLFQGDGTLLVVGVLLASAVLSWPVSIAVHRYGTYRGFWVSFLAIALSVIALYSMTATVALLAGVVVFSVAYTALSVSSLPLAISRSGFSEKVFCVGVFFSGVALPEALWEAWIAWA